MITAIRHVVVILMGAVLLALLVVTATLLFLSMSEGGTRFLAAQAEQFLPVRLEAVSGSLYRHVQVGRLRFELGERTLVIDALDVRLDLPRALFENRLELEWVEADRVVLSEPAAPSPQDGAPFELVLPYMPLDIDLDRLRIDRLEIAGAPPMRVAGAATWTSDGIAIPSFEVISDAFRVELRGLLGSGGNPRLEAELAWALTEGGWAGDATVTGRVAALELQHELRGPYPAVAEGIVNLARPADPEFDLQVEVEPFTAGELAVGPVEGRIDGSLDALQVHASTALTLPRVGAVEARVRASGPVSGPVEVALEAALLDGTLALSGNADWRDGLRLSLAGDAADLDLAQLREQMRGRVSSALAVDYRDGRVTAEIDDLHGTLNDRELAGQIRVAQSDRGWVLAPLRLRAGPNRLDGELRWNDGVLDAEAEIDAPSLRGLSLGIAGDLRGSIEVSGTWPELDGSADLQSTGLEGFGVEMATLQGNGSLRGGEMDLSLRMDSLTRDEVTLTGVALTGRGDFERLNWELRTDQGEGSGDLEVLDAGYRFGIARAEFSALNTRWRTSDPLEVTLIDGAVAVSPVCLQGGRASACLDRLDWRDGALDTAGKLDRLPVRLLRPWLPVRLGRGAYLEGGWDLAGAGEDWTGEVRLHARELAYPLPDAGERIELPDLSLRADLLEQRLVASLTAEGDAFDLDGSVQLAALRADGALSGEVVISASDLAALRVFDQRIETVTGRLDGRVRISGTPAAPWLEGRVELADGSVALLGPDFSLSDIDLTVELDEGGQARLAGSARQPDGRVTLEGQGTDLFVEQRNFRVALRGENLAASEPQWDVRVSPDLAFEWAEQRGRVSGRVTLPHADVRLATLPGSVPRPSEDVVVVGRESEPRAAVQPVTVNVDVVLGEDVQLRALGITAQLEGALNARVGKRGETTVRGTLDVTGGVLSAQGQTLRIDSGTVVYNGPVGNPYLDLRAVRDIEDQSPPITVGLHIRGNADNLTSSVFSEPPMAETRALSFLVLGRDLEEGSDADSGQLVAAAINLGLSRSGGVVSELRRMTGLDELSAQAETQDSFAIVAGKRVGDDLYLRYTYNTLSAVGAFLVRYDLTSRWHLEARSGEASSMDLMYSFEK